jgi:hypothetical protein
MSKYRKELVEKGIEINEFKGFLDTKRAAFVDADTGAPTPITNANVGVPVELATFFDPIAVEILTAPRNATQLFDETVKGSWADERRKYRLEESVGNVAPYGDYSENGQADVNNEFIPQDFYRFQTVAKWGDLETARTAIAKINLVSSKQRSAAKLMNIASNRIYMFGVAGLDIYGILNHPLLPANLTPTQGTAGTNWEVKTANEIFDDFLKTISDLIEKSSSLIDANSTFRVGLAANLMGYLNKTNQFGLSALDMLKKNYPNLTTVPIPEFATPAGSYMYIIAIDVVGQKTGECITNQKLRTFPIIPDLSSFKQKWASGIGGFCLYLPFAVSRMLIA